MPPKPRVKAPKQRTSQRRAEAEAKKRRLYMLGGGALVAVLAIAGIAALLGLTTSDAGPADVRKKVVAAGGTFRAVNALAGEHTLQADARSDSWNTDPPTSGPHFGFDNNQNLGTAIWGAYDEPLQPARVVHNLEHGGIFIFYGNKVRPQVVAQLREFYNDHQLGTLLAPYAKLRNQIALGAWVVHDDLSEKAYLAKLKKFDEDAFSAFFEAFQFKGPERFPSSSLLPGRS